MASFTYVYIRCYQQDVYPRVAMGEGAVSEGRYSWETAVLNAFTADPETVAAKIETAKQGISDRLRDQNTPDASETAALIYALEALDTLGALGRVIDPNSKAPTSES